MRSFDIDLFVEIEFIGPVFVPPSGSGLAFGPAITREALAETELSMALRVDDHLVLGPRDTFAPDYLIGALIAAEHATGTERLSLRIDSATRLRGEARGETVALSRWSELAETPGEAEILYRGEYYRGLELPETLWQQAIYTAVRAFRGVWVNAAAGHTETLLDELVSSIDRG